MTEQDKDEAERKRKERNRRIAAALDAMVGVLDGMERRAKRRKASKPDAVDHAINIVTFGVWND